MDELRAYSRALGLVEKTLRYSDPGCSEPTTRKPMDYFDQAAIALSEEVRLGSGKHCSWRTKISEAIMQHLPRDVSDYGAIITERGRHYYAWGFDVGMRGMVCIEKTDSRPVHAYCEVGAIDGYLASIYLNQQENRGNHEQI